MSIAIAIEQKPIRIFIGTPSKFSATLFSFQFLPSIINLLVQTNKVWYKERPGIKAFKFLVMYLAFKFLNFMVPISVPSLKIFKVLGPWLGTRLIWYWLYSIQQALVLSSIYIFLPDSAPKTHYQSISSEILPYFH